MDLEDLTPKQLQTRALNARRCLYCCLHIQNNMLAMIDEAKDRLIAAFKAGVKEARFGVGYAQLPTQIPRVLRRIGDKRLMWIPSQIPGPLILEGDVFSADLYSVNGILETLPELLTQMIRVHRDQKTKTKMDNCERCIEERLFSSSHKRKSVALKKPHPETGKTRMQVRL